MFQHIYNRRRKVAWAYGPVTSYSLSLHEIDTVQNSRAFIPSALETIVRKVVGAAVCWGSWCVGASLDYVRMHACEGGLLS